jgi:hypothetical protein
MLNAMLDKAEPFVSLKKGYLCQGMLVHPLLYVAERAFSGRAEVFEAAEKIHLLLERGADVGVRDEDGRSCIHLVLNSLMNADGLYDHCEIQLKDVLMRMVTFGADIDACDKRGESVPETACKVGYEELWLEIVAECGKDPEPVLHCLNNYYRKQNPGFGVFATGTPNTQSNRLSFSECNKQRRSPAFRADGKCDENYRTWRRKRNEWNDFLELVKEESDGEDDDIHSGKRDIYSTEHEVDWLR